MERVKEAYAQGRLDKPELDQRMDQAFSARTHGELAVLLHDLPDSGGTDGRLQGRLGGPPEPDPTVASPTAPPPAAARLWGASGHLAGMVSSFIGPLVLYLLADRRDHYVRRHLAEAVNFQLTLLLVTIVTFGLGAIVYTVAWVVALVAAAQALAGDRFHCPYTLRLLR